ncbi:MAG: 7-cyano-7-deazaguanine synthase QueC [Candidatus Altiarchaeota archaeon]
MGGKAVCLISGGLDSAVCAAIARDRGCEIYALTFDYGQQHRREVESAKKIAKFYKAREHMILDAGLGRFGGSSLTSGDDVPQGKKFEEIKNSIEIPSTYVSARNTIFLSYALAYAETVDADSIYIGANHIDYSGYPDCRPEYFKAFQKMADLATKRAVEGKPVKIEHPIIELDKKAIVKLGIKLNVPFELTWSCYAGRKRACGRCDSCILRLNGFREAGIKDPIDYEKQMV